MYHTDRMAYLRAYWPGLICINFANFFLAGNKNFQIIKVKVDLTPPPPPVPLFYKHTAISVIPMAPKYS